MNCSGCKLLLGKFVGAKFILCRGSIEFICLTVHLLPFKHFAVCILYGRNCFSHAYIEWINYTVYLTYSRSGQVVSSQGSVINNLDRL